MPWTHEIVGYSDSLGYCWCTAHKGSARGAVVALYADGSHTAWCDEHPRCGEIPSGERSDAGRMVQTAYGAPERTL